MNRPLHMCIHGCVISVIDNFRMNTGYGRCSATYNMVALSCFNDKLPYVWVELLLLPKNPTEAKLQATRTWVESTEPTKGVMKHTYKVVLYNYCLMRYCCILSFQLVCREGCKPNQWGRYPNPWIPVQSVTGKAHNPSVIQHLSHCPFSNMSSQ
jgi:hypothetical protein